MSPDWLSQLAPSHAPPPPGWWPPAPGWWVLAILGAILVGGFIWWLVDRRRAEAAFASLLWTPRRAALSELRQIRQSEADAPVLAQSIESLLRRYALAVFGPERVASLTGEAWLQLVISEGGELLAGGPGRSLLAAAFGGRTGDDREQWLAGAEAFVRTAPRPKSPSKKAARGR